MCAIKSSHKQLLKIAFLLEAWAGKLYSLHRDLTSGKVTVYFKVSLLQCNYTFKY